MLRFFIIGMILIVLTGCAPKTKPTIQDDPTAALIRRIVKDKADAFVIEYIDQDRGKDVFEVESGNDKIILRGNNGVAVASALNYYLKYYCFLDVSWNNMTVTLPEKLPLVKTKVHKASPYKYRYYLNYCTFNYTMAWWNWERWQQEIDWMALHGINMPLALTGEEAIWKDVYRQMGFTDKELESFFTGPAYFSWFWMGNIDKWGGPLPQHWMDTHRDLQQKILERERALGMTSVLPAFTGHVPPAFKEKFPHAKLKKTNWEAGFDDVYILDAEDSLFEKIGSLFLDAQTKVYGTDHFYSADTFNENVPPTSDTVFLHDISEKVYKSMANTDPQAIWVMQGWMFHYNADYWKPAQIRSILSGAPENHIIVLDLYSETHPVWKETHAYYGTPWIWNMLQNFGGNVSMFGRMSNVAKDPAEALHHPQAGKLLGIGLTPEGSEQNPALFELMLENVWQSDSIDLDQWLKGYAKRRYGSEDIELERAWSMLKNTVYSGGLGEGGAESIIVARPTFALQGHRVLTKLDYNPMELMKAWEIFVDRSYSFDKSDAFQYDLVDITRQVLANYASPLQQKIARAYEKKDLNSFDKYSAEFIELIEDMDMLLATRKEFLLGKWINDARSWGITEDEKNLYEFNARDLVTLWGDKNSELHEYSNRQWSGLLNKFYKPRWQQFFAEAKTSLQTHGKMDLKAFEERIKEWEWNWVNTRDAYNAEPQGKPSDLAAMLFGKYKEKLIVMYSASKESL
jgi:alpha-N-acetylglucosaminidase